MELERLNKDGSKVPLTQTRKKTTDGRHRKFLGAGGCILMAGIYGCFQK